jgi:hypothetical protein
MQNGKQIIAVPAAEYILGKNPPTLSVINV